ncbi:hypothetical protein ACAX43_31705 [Paraburkholderia sp. IW21]|uniref:hypothetical protein n=1 Tax=Paraburkholderia sp. IW21 TaxID=3242488 RepID=UPI00351FB901
MRRKAHWQIVGLDESLGLRQQPDRVAVHLAARQNVCVEAVDGGHRYLIAIPPVSHAFSASTSMRGAGA